MNAETGPRSPSLVTGRVDELENRDVGRETAISEAARQSYEHIVEPGEPTQTTRPSAQLDPPATLLRLARAIDSETEGLYRRKDNGDHAVLPLLRAIAFRLLELGFTIAEEGGIECHHIEVAVARAYGLPGYDGLACST